MAGLEDDSPTPIIVGAHDLSLREKLESLPAQPGIYQFKASDGKVIYVGKAANLRSRVRQYFQKSRSADPRIDAMMQKIRDLDLTVTKSEIEALILEANLIKKLKPRYNVLLKDDKSYPYIVITNEQFPRVFVTRRRVPGARTFGPYTDVKTMRFALKTVRDAFMIRSCNYDLTETSISAGKFKLCLDYHIRKCEGPCEGLVGRTHYNTMIDRVARVLKGKSREVTEDLNAEMEHLSTSLKFEEAARIRDKVRALGVYSDKQRIVENSTVDRDVFAVASLGDDACGVVFKVREGKVVGSRHLYMTHTENRTESEVLEQLLERYYLDEEDIPPLIMLNELPESDSTLREWLSARTGAAVTFELPKAGEKLQLLNLVRNNAQYWLDELEVQRLKRGEAIPFAVQSLQKDLRLPSPPRRIECFDNSNIHGSDPVSSMVVFVDGKPRKSEYRKFKIRSVEGPDDFETMKEVVGRRYRRAVAGEISMPDLIVIDGGKGQLSSSLTVLKDLGVDQTPIIGLAKKLEEIFVPGLPDPVLLPKASSSLKLLQRLRDEAHRFAVTYHRQLRTKRILSTELDLIGGVGKKRTQELLEVFGSVQGVKFASIEQLAEVVGEKVAGTIKEYFADESDLGSSESYGETL